MLKIDNLTKYYGKVRGIENLSLDLKAGEIFGIIGPNGAGKSTTIKCIMNLINKSSGSIYINNILNSKDNIELKKIIGYLPSEINLYDDVTVKEMLDYNEKFYNFDTHEKRLELVKKLELNESKKVDDLSFGNLKKLGIVLALMHSPKLLILDEPTSGLDPIMQEVFYQVLLDLKKSGVTIFYSTHILSEIKKICDRVGIIKDGNLIKIENISSITNEQLQIVTIKCPNIEDLKFSNIIEKTNDTIKFIYSNSIDKLIKQISKYKIDKLLIEDPSIEEVFMHYYK